MHYSKPRQERFQRSARATLAATSRLVATRRLRTTLYENCSKGTCTVKAGKGGGSGEVKELHHGQCDSNGADLYSAHHND